MNLADITNINILATLVAAIAAFMVGGLWYSPILFAKKWAESGDIKFDALPGKVKGRVMGTTFLMWVLVSVGMAAVLGADAGWEKGITTGILASVLFIIPYATIQHSFEQRPLALRLINAGRPR